MELDSSLLDAAQRIGSLIRQCRFQDPPTVHPQALALQPRILKATELFVRLVLGRQARFLETGDLPGVDLTEVVQEISYLSELSRKLGNSPDLIPDLFAVHFRSSLLEDGRATYAGSSRLEECLRDFVQRSGGASQDIDMVEEIVEHDCFGSRFHEDLLAIYRRLYTRPFSFNDRIFQLAEKRPTGDAAAPSRSVWTVLFHFKGKSGSPLLERQHDLFGSRFVIRLSPNLVAKLQDSEAGDLRNSILRKILGTRSHESRCRGRLLLSPPRELRRELAEAVEMVWHRILACEESIAEWKDFLYHLGFLERKVDSWQPTARIALFDALRFVQGVSLYEMVAPDGLSTTLFPSLQGQPERLGALTIGTSSRSVGIEAMIDRLLPWGERILTALYSSAVEPIACSGAETPHTRQNAYTLLEGHLGNAQLAHETAARLELNPLRERVLVDVLRLCMQLCHEKHEQVGLNFRFFIGSAVDLASFHEVYMFRSNGGRDEQAEFKSWDAGKRAKCLKAHYSHLQDPRIGLFFEWEERVHFRFIEMVSGRHAPLPHGEAGVADDRQATSRSASAKKLTREVDGLVVADAGEGRVSVYFRGEVVLAWPEHGLSSWWSPGQARGWSSQEAIEELLRVTSERWNGGLDQEDVRRLAEALIWVSETPGMGCSLALTTDIDDEKGLKPHRVSLNLKKFSWVDQIPLGECEARDLRNLFVQDGATVLSFKTGCLINQIQLVPFDRQRGEVLDPARSNGAEHRWTSGTRHTSACDITEVVPGCIVITVSADGPISVFKEGEKITSPEKLRWS